MRQRAPLPDIPLAGHVSQISEPRVLEPGVTNARLSILILPAVLLHFVISLSAATCGAQEAMRLNICPLY